jgi:hypothetical protein
VIRARRSTKLARSLAVALLALSLPSPARAQGSTRATVAEQMFLDGRALIAQHRYKEACAKLEASQRLDPAVGTLFSLGECNMGQGRTASAWLAYRRAVTLANERKDPRNAAADERSNAVEPQLSRLVLHVGDAARALDVQITVNGDRLERDVYGEPMPIDPGPATIVATAPRYRPWTAHVVVGPIADTVNVDVPALEPLPDAAEVARQESRATTRRTLGYVSGGAGIVAVAVGTILGLQAIVKIRDANDVCPSSLACASQSAVQSNDTGRSFADASTVLLPVGAVLLGVGSYLLLTSKEARGPEVRASVAAGGGQLGVGWSW